MRITREAMWMDMAEVAAKRSVCFRGNIGCLIIYNNNILSMGYNGPAKGEEHCKGKACELNAEGGCARSVHAEMNAIDRARQKTQFLTECDMYSTFSPCLDCAKVIMEEQLNHFYYRYSYRDKRGLEFLLKHMPVYRITPSGIIVSEATGMVMKVVEIEAHA